MESNYQLKMIKLKSIYKKSKNIKQIQNRLKMKKWRIKMCCFNFIVKSLEFMMIVWNQFKKKNQKQ